MADWYLWHYQLAQDAAEDSGLMASLIWDDPGDIMLREVRITLFDFYRLPNTPRPAMLTSDRVA